jgi:hypothetical protein
MRFDREPINRTNRSDVENIAPLTEQESHFLGKRGHFGYTFDSIGPTQNFLTV